MNEANKRKDSPIEVILYCEFDSRAGPVIVHQVPNEYVTKEQFDSLRNYLIPKPKSERRLLTINALGLKIIGYPIGIDNSRYSRNRLIFNICFVCLPDMRTFYYEPIVKKLNRYFEELELECQFLTNSTTRNKIPDILEDIRVKLNEHKVCKIEMNPFTTINLKMVSVHPDPEEALEELVPVFVASKQNLQPSQWDLTTQQIIPYIDGFRHIDRIATEADVEVSLVKACIQNMIYYGIVKLIPIFQYSNCYLPTQSLVSLFKNEDIMNECIKAVCRNNISAHSVQESYPKPKTVFRIFCSMNYGVTVRDLCLQYNPQNQNIDEKKLIRFGLMKGYIRRVHRYPVLLTANDRTYNSDNHDLSSSLESVAHFFDGDHNFDQICCKASKLNYNVRELQEDVDKREDVLIINK